MACEPPASCSPLRAAVSYYRDEAASAGLYRLDFKTAGSKAPAQSVDGAIERPHCRLALCINGHDQIAGSAGCGTQNVGEAVDGIFLV